MKKLLLLGAALVAVIATMSAGTWAYFNDTATSQGNIITAGTLYLGTVTPQAQVGLSTATPSGTKAIQLDTVYVYPGAAGGGSVTVANSGNLAGSLDLAIANLTNTEAVSGKYSDSDEPGELGANAYMAIYLDKDADGWGTGDVALTATGTGTKVDYSADAVSGTATSGTTLTVVDSTKTWTPDQWIGYQVTVTGKGSAMILDNDATTLTLAAPISAVSTQAYQIASGIKYSLINDYDTDSWTTAQSLAASGSTTVVILWVVPTSVGNTIQGDHVDFDVDFTLNQS